MIERIAALLADLRPAGDPPAPREVAELLWLARVLPATPATSCSTAAGQQPAGAPA
ncbi:MAG: hypothetical protein HOY69_21175, partial [Streptomyces sp.]|nr:hypothetical protein [Streptomyces sp.]